VGTGTKGTITVAPCYPTPGTGGERRLKLGGLKAGEKMFDLGSGDGRVVIMAADKFKGAADCATPGAQHIPADLRATLAASAGPISRWAEALLDTRGGYILGMGALGATAFQGALLMKEKTFLHIEGMSLSEFRHGNIEVVTPGLPIIVLAVTPAQAAEAVKHAEYFASIGAEVCLITDSPVEASRLPADRILQVQNGGDAYTGQLQVVVPLQLLAERVAVRKGHDVDGFRYIAKVVDKYKL